MNFAVPKCTFKYKQCIIACLENMHAASALFHGKTFSNNNIGKTNTWMDKIADT